MNDRLVQKYFNKHVHHGPFIEQKPDADLQLILTIPCFKEPDVLQTLKSLQACSNPPKTEVLINVNHSEEASQEIREANAKTNLLFQSAQLLHPHIDFHLINTELPKKEAGVGLARKIIMDEALRRFLKIEKDGIIVCLDADSRVEANYLQAISRHFKTHPHTPGCSIYFEHPTSGTDYATQVYDSIIAYELFLRYYKQGLTYANLPYDFHTIGSSMAVRASAYLKAGGMNKRKAGEDFYFLQKIIKQKGFTELNATKVIPSPRPSDRVPFGTGRAVEQFLNTQKTIEGYAPNIFKYLKELSVHIDALYINNDVLQSLDTSIQVFFTSIHAAQSIDNIRENATSLQQFKTFFFEWFDAFKCLKYVHYARDHFYANKPIENAAKKLLQALNIQPSQTTLELLGQFRSLDKTGNSFSMSDTMFKAFID